MSRTITEVWSDVKAVKVDGEEMREIDNSLSGRWSGQNTQGRSKHKFPPISSSIYYSLLEELSRVFSYVERNRTVFAYFHGFNFLDQSPSL